MFSLKILDTSTSATLFVSLIGALLLRHQYALGVLPRINYKSTPTSRQTTKNGSEWFETWRVEIRNTGLGTAIINRTEYLTQQVNEKSDCHSYTFNEIINELTKINLVRDCDYWIEKITSGFSLSPKDDCFAFEIKTEHIAKLQRLTMVLFFQGQLGDKYCKEISLLPRK